MLKIYIFYIVYNEAFYSDTGPKDIHGGAERQGECAAVETKTD